MKKINIILVFCLVLVISLMFVACNKDKQKSEPTPAPEPTQHTHTWASEWTKDTTKHWHTCSGCTEKNDEAVHVYTDDSDTTCNICGYERTLAHTHTWENDWSMNSTNHWHACSGCSEKNDLAAHVYTDDTDATCNTCGFVRTPAHVHTWATDWSTDPTNHWHACSGCTDKKDTAAHVYTDAHDTTCNTCGYVRSIGDHAAATAWTTTDATHHWKACTHDGCTIKFEYGEHEYDDDHDTICDCGHVREIDPDHYDSGILDFDDTHHWTTCAHTGCTIEFNAANHSGLNTWYNDETNHWHQCGLCGYIKDQAAHVYDDNLDNTCNICGYDRHTHSWASEWSSNATNHWHACSGCSEKNDEAAHVYTDDHDTTCNTCGYVRSIGDHVAATEWSHDADGHWHACQYDGCELKFDYSAHLFTDAHDTTCNTCGYVRSLGDHAAATEWSHDADGHWHACQHDGCELKFDYAAHNTPDTHGFCPVCGEFLGQVIPADTRNDLGMLTAGTYYFKLSGVTGRGVNVAADTNITNYSIVFYRFDGGDYLDNTYWSSTASLSMIWAPWEVFVKLTVNENQTINNYIQINTEHPQ